MILTSGVVMKLSRKHFKQETVWSHVKRLGVVQETGEQEEAALLVHRKQGEVG